MSLRDQVNQVLQALTDARGAVLRQGEGLSFESRENSAVLTASPADLPDGLDAEARQYFQNWRVKDLAVRIAIVSGDGQTARTEHEVEDPIVVRVADFHGDAVVGALVHFSPTRGSGAIIGSRATTNADGCATAFRWRLGQPGENQLVATLVGSGRGTLSVTIRATATKRSNRPTGLVKSPTT